MRHVEIRVLSVAILFGAGCASPFLAGTNSRRTTASSSQTQEGAGERSPAKPADADRIAAGRDAMVAAGRDRRIAELLASGARNQQARNFAAARADYEQVLVLDPINPQANFKLAILADDEGRFADSDRHYSLLLRQYPGNATLLANRGWSYVLQGRYAEAERTLSEALRADPNHRAALKNLGWLYGTLGDYEQALAFFRRAGTEAEAQRILTELKETRRGPADSVPNIAAANWQAAPGGPAVRIPKEEFRGGVSAPPPPTSPIRFASVKEGPEPGAPRILGGSPEAGQRGTAGAADRFSEVDSYAGSSPSQANRPGQADGDVSNDPSRWGTQDRTQLPAGDTWNVDPSRGSAARSHYPVITPRSDAVAPPPNGAPTIGREGDDRRAVEGLGPATPSDPPEWRQNGGAGSAPSNAQFAPGSEPYPARTDGMQQLGRGPSSWQEVQRIAAQVGLSAGSTGPLFPILDLRGVPPADAFQAPIAPADGSGPPAARLGGGAAPFPASGSHPASGPRRESVPFEASGLQSPQSPAWPRGGTLLPPIPTDVIASPEPPTRLSPGVSGAPPLRP
jgi:Flp pilus assembly protein TadD